MKEVIEELMRGKVDDVAPHFSYEGYLFYALCGIGYFFLQHAVLHLIIPLYYP